MIDFHKELAKFDFATAGTELTDFHSETIHIIEAVATAFKRIGKEVNHTNIQLEDFFALQSEETDKDKHIAEQNRTLAVMKDQMMSLVHGLIATMDMLEDVYRYSLYYEQNSWGEQMRLLWHKAAANMLLLGITRIEGEDTPFDARIHTAVQTLDNNDVANGLVLDVLRSGYIYNLQVLRKAQVVVNKINGAGDNE
ncbi:MAG: nucleotide exchange factor GrpE [Peptococcaceae bacterium]|nr:nucleotide exchange factor GrpE [Peptococcaceae bacterium]